MEHTLTLRLAFLAAACTPFATLHAQSPTSLELGTANILDRETSANVGEILPQGIHLLGSGGGEIDLRDKLHGLTILFTFMTSHVPPGWLQAIQRSSGKSLDGTRAGIAIIVVSPNAAEASLDVPRNVEVFRSPLPLETGSLARNIYPTRFYFDAQRKLVRRQPGIPMDVETLLHFPSH